MINLKANKKLKSMGCKWSGVEWVAPGLANDDAQAIKDHYYDDLVTVKVTTNKMLDEGSLGYAHARLIAGYVVATAKGRDSGARVADGVAFIEGRAKSGGSMKNYRCDIAEGAVIKMKVSRNVLNDMDAEAAEELYTYEILEEQETIESFEAKREKLKNELESIELKIKSLKGDQK